jgi:hypothetical protein
MNEVTTKKIIIFITILCSFIFADVNCRFDDKTEYMTKDYRFTCDKPIYSFSINTLINPKETTEYRILVTKNRIVYLQQKAIENDYEYTETYRYDNCNCSNNNGCHIEKIVDIVNDIVLRERQWCQRYEWDLPDTFEDYWKKLRKFIDSNVNYNKELNNEDSVYSTENEVKETETKDTYTEYRIAQIMEKYK